MEVQLKKNPPVVVSGRKYDWSDINRMLADDSESITYVCRDSKEATEAMLTLKCNKACRNKIIAVSMRGNKVKVSRL